MPGVCVQRGTGGKEFMKILKMIALAI